MKWQPRDKELNSGNDNNNNNSNSKCSVKSLTLKWKGTNTCASAPRFFWALILKASLLAISNFSAFPADGVGADVPGAAMSFTLFFELNMLSICSSI